MLRVRATRQVCQLCWVRRAFGWRRGAAVFVAVAQRRSTLICVLSLGCACRGIGTGRILAAAAGTSKSHALSATIWLKDINRDFAAMNEVWNAWVDPENKPVRATVEAAMARDVLLVEIQVTAALDKNPFEDLNY
mmetsp:Transcript_24254/g.73994  ORF Transcript_24254/g.73994 Transcript_24254/m.73994 type:complete len:135 (-) Transcript_24254:5-409(-)